MFNQEANRSDNFEQISDIREILYQEKVEECERLAIEVRLYKESCENWKNCYDYAMKRISDYCIGNL